MGSFDFLRAIFKSAKVYIRPLQRDIDESPEKIVVEQCYVFVL